MKAEELRIGNIVEWSDNEMKGDKNHIINHNDFGNAEFFNPVIITNKILLDFGLARSGMVYSNPENSFEIEVTKDGIIYYTTFHDDVKLEYIHQLQNLYHSLIGSELTIQV